MVYAFAFLLSCFLLYSVDKIRNNNMRTCAIGFGILPLVLLAMFRADTVGIDVLVYVKRCFMLANNSKNFFLYWDIVDKEFGYALINFLLSRITNNLMWLHLLNQLLVILPITIAVRMSKNYIATWYGMLCWYLFFYNWSLNAIRQSIACAWVFLAIVLWFKGKYRKSIISFFFAFSFHYTVIFALSLFGLNYLFKRKKVNKYLFIIILLMCYLCVLNFESIFTVLQQIIPALNTVKYNNYLNTTLVTNGAGKVYIGFKILCLWIALVLRKKRKNMELNNYLLSIQVFTFIFIPLAYKINFAYRLLKYFDLFNLLLLPQSLSVFPPKSKNRFLLNGIVLMAMTLFWIMTYLIQGNGGTIPYKLI